MSGAVVDPGFRNGHHEESQSRISFLASIFSLFFSDLLFFLRSVSLKTGCERANLSYLTSFSDPRDIQTNNMIHFNMQETTELEMSKMIVLDIFVSWKGRAVKSWRGEARDWCKMVMKVGPQICAKTGESRFAGKTFAIVRTPRLRIQFIHHPPRQAHQNSAPGPHSTALLPAAFTIHSTTSTGTTNHQCISLFRDPF